MSPPSKTTSKPAEPAVNWQLIADEFKVMQQYSCHDGKAGLSDKDVEYFKKTNPELFEEMIDAYPRDIRPGLFSVKYSYSARYFIDRFANKGFINLARAVATIMEPILGRPLWGRPGGDQLLQGVFNYFDQSRVPKQLNSLEKIKSTLEKAFKEKGVPIKPEFTIIELGKGRFNTMQYGIILEFPSGPCKKPGKGIPNV